MGLELNQSVDGAPTEQEQGRLLTALLKIIVDSRAVIGLSLLLCLALALSMLRGPSVYKVEALLIPNTEQASSMRAAAPIGLAGLLAGSQTAMPELDEFEELLSSPETAAVLDKKYNLLHDVFKSAWDSKNKRWYPPGWKDRLHYGIVEALSGVAHDEPNDYDLAKFLGSGVQVQRYAFGNVMSISMLSDRPEDAKRWLSLIIYEVSDVVRSQMINERQNYVNYLQQQLAESGLTSSRDAVISILSDQYRSLMVLKSAKTFPIEQIQPPTRSQFPVNKSVSLDAAYGILAGLMVAGILITCGVRDAALLRFFSGLLRWNR